MDLGTVYSLTRRFVSWLPSVASTCLFEAGNKALQQALWYLQNFLTTRIARWRKDDSGFLKQTNRRAGSRKDGRHSGESVDRKAPDFSRTGAGDRRTRIPST